MSAPRCACSPGPGGHRGEFSAWDIVQGREVWTIKERFPVWSGTSPPRATWSSTAPWTAGSKPCTPVPARCCGSSRPAPGSSASRPPTAARTASSTSRSSRASAAGRARSSRPTSTRATRTARTAGSTRCGTCRSTPPRAGRSMSSACRRPLLARRRAAARRRRPARTGAARLRRPEQPALLQRDAGGLREPNLGDPGPRPRRRPHLHMARAAPRLPPRDRCRPALCDVVPGTAGRHRRCCAPPRPTTAPPTSSSPRADRGLPSLASTTRGCASSTIGVQLVGDDGVNPPPAHALARRGLVQNLRGYTRLRRLQPAEPAGAHRGRGGGGRGRCRRGLGAARRLVRHARQPVPLCVWPVSPQARRAAPSDGLRHRHGRAAGGRGASPRRSDARARRATARAVDAMLAEYGVPRFDGGAGARRCACARACSCVRARLLAACEREEREPRPDQAAPRVPRRDHARAPPGSRGPPNTSGMGERLRADACHVSEGKRLYTWFNCNGCHGNGGGGMGPALMDDKWIYGGDLAEHRRRPSARAGRTACRASAARIPDEQIWQIAAYVRSMGGHVPPGRGAGPERRHADAARREPHAAARPAAGRRSRPRRKAPQ